MQTTRQAKRKVLDRSEKPNGVPGEIEYGWHYIQGNSGAHFAVTARFDGSNGYGGACHELIAELAPDLKPLIALHLSDAETGEPMHAEANGWYWLAGTLPGKAGERYTGADGSIPKSMDECLQIFADHCRIDLAFAQEIQDKFSQMLLIRQPDSEGFQALCKSARKAFASTIEAMRPRWKAEADAERARLTTLDPVFAATNGVAVTS